MNVLLTPSQNLFDLRFNPAMDIDPGLTCQAPKPVLVINHNKVPVSGMAPHSWITAQQIFFSASLLEFKCAERRLYAVLNAFQTRKKSFPLFLAKAQSVSVPL